MITVHVKLFATLRRYFPDLEIGQAMAVELPAGATASQLFEQIGLPAELVKVVFVNNRVRQEDHLLEAGDRVGIFPPVGGG